MTFNSQFSKQPLLNVVLVGQPDYFEICHPGIDLDWGLISFLPFSSGGNETQLRYDLLELQPDVVIVYKPEMLQSNCLEGVNAARIGWFTEPVTRTDKASVAQNHATRQRWGEGIARDSNDLQRRLDNAKGVVKENYDIFVSFDPLTLPALNEFVSVEHAFPLPVGDRTFCTTPETFSTRPRRLTFIGRSTPYRDQFLLPILHEYDPLYICHGLHGNDLDYVMANTGIGLNLHNDHYPNFENRVPIHLARGHLVISEPLSPSHGLEPGQDFVEITSPDELAAVLNNIWDDPEPFRLIAIRGREKAEYFRSSNILQKVAHLVP